MISDYLNIDNSIKSVIYFPNPQSPIPNPQSPIPKEANLIMNII